MGNSKNVIAVRVSDATKSEIEAYRDANGDISQSDAMKELLTKGLRYEELEAKMEKVEEIDQGVDELEAELQNIRAATNYLAEQQAKGPWWKFW